MKQEELSEREERERVGEERQRLGISNHWPHVAGAHLTQQKSWQKNALSLRPAGCERRDMDALYVWIPCWFAPYLSLSSSAFRHWSILAQW